jgi:hypothetical protein
MVREAKRLMAADADRSQEFRPVKTDLVIGPANARERLWAGGRRRIGDEVPR